MKEDKYAIFKNKENKIKDKNTREFFSDLLGLPVLKKELALKRSFVKEEKTEDEFSPDEIERFEVDMIRSLNFYKNRCFLFSAALWAPATFLMVNYSVIKDSSPFLFMSIILSAFCFLTIQVKNSDSYIYISMIEKFLTKHNKLYKNDRKNYVLYAINRGFIKELDDLVFVAINKKGKSKECIVFKNKKLKFYSVDEFESCDAVHNDIVIDLKKSQVVLQNMARIT